MCKKYDPAYIEGRPLINYGDEFDRLGIKLSKTDYFNIQAGQLLIKGGHRSMSPLELNQQLSNLVKGEVGQEI